MAKLINKTISMIAARDRNNAIGRGNDLPWHIPEDWRYFKQTTLGKPIIMGRKTFQAVGKPLPGRLNIVITREPDAYKDQESADVTFVSDLKQAFAKADSRAEQDGQEEVFVIGGGQIYSEALGDADRLYLTDIDIAVEGADAYFPEFSEEEWSEVSNKPASNENHRWVYRVFERKP